MDDDAPAQMFHALECGYCIYRMCVSPRRRSINMIETLPSISLTFTDGSDEQNKKLKKATVSGQKRMKIKFKCLSM